jgi:hypothetical protein
MKTDAWSGAPERGQCYKNSETSQCYKNSASVHAAFSLQWAFFEKEVLTSI